MNKNGYIKLPSGSDSNFTYNELIKSDTAKRLGIKNEPNDIQWKALEALTINVLQPIRNKFGLIRVTSGFRSPELCLKINSNVNSNHTRGEAADIEPVDGRIKLFRIIEWIHDNLDYRELIAEFFPDGWIHVAYRNGGNNRTLKLKDNDHNYKVVTLDYIRKLYA